MRILLLRLSALGDIVTGLHVLSTLRARFCSAHIGWLVEDRFASLLRGHPQIDSLHVYDRQQVVFPWKWWRLVALAAQLRRQRYDIAIDLQGNLKSGALAWGSGAKRRIGLDKPLSREGNALFIRERVAAPAGHRIQAYLALLDTALGQGRTAYAELPHNGEPHGGIVLHPGVSRFGAFKRWPAAAFAELGDRLAARLGTSVVLTAGPGERDQAEAVKSAMSRSVEIATTPTLQALVNLLAGAKLVVACDTGPAHLAAATGVPTLVLFGPKNPDVHAPAGPRVATVRKGVRCSPCTLRSCPDPICMTTLTVDEVEAAALELLA